MRGPIQNAWNQILRNVDEVQVGNSWSRLNHLLTAVLDGAPTVQTLLIFLAQFADSVVNWSSPQRDDVEKHLRSVLRAVCGHMLGRYSILIHFRCSVVAVKACL